MLGLSISEIIERGEESRPQPLPFRYLPLEVIASAKVHLTKTGKTDETLRYVLYSYYTYRDTVNRDMLAPHYLYLGAYQWPRPARFSWANVNAVIVIGESIFGEIPNNRSEVVIETQEKGGITTKRVNPETGITKSDIRNIVQGRDNLNEVLKYRIKDMSRISFLFCNDWQLSSLDAYANPFYFFLKDYLEGKYEEKRAKEMLENALRNLRRMKI